MNTPSETVEAMMSTGGVTGVPSDIQDWIRETLNLYPDIRRCTCVNVTRLCMDSRAGFVYHVHLTYDGSSHRQRTFGPYSNWFSNETLMQSRIEVYVAHEVAAKHKEAKPPSVSPGDVISKELLDSLARFAQLLEQQGRDIADLREHISKR